MPEIEVPLEQASEDTMHHAKHSGERWIEGVALSSAIVAVLAALTAMLAGHHSDEAMIDQIKSSDQWSFYQAKSIKANLAGTKVDIMIALGKEAAEHDKDKIQEYKKEMEEIQEKAKEFEAGSERHLKHHIMYARGVTMFQIAIAISAISALTRRRRFWLVGVAFALGGICFLGLGLNL